MGMERHEVPTVFVRGAAVPGEVAYAERELRLALLSARAVSFVVLSIDTEGVDPAVVAVEVGIDGEDIEARAAGATVRIAADLCIEDLIAHLARSLVENGI
ncbi:MAG: hypothetical protein JWL83_4376 [Actinomycetia bacterium]|nr:hypothetical protein [Actinomycetes bacterium]